MMSPLLAWPKQAEGPLRRDKVSGSACVENFESFESTGENNLGSADESGMPERIPICTKRTGDDNTEQGFSEGGAGVPVTGIYGRQRGLCQTSIKRKILRRPERPAFDESALYIEML
jgi:hypothetical protein